MIPERNWRAWPALAATLMLLAATVPLPAPSVALAAAPPLDLVLGGEGAQALALADIAPGDSGTLSVSLHNAGTSDGYVSIWISDIVSGEGANPEPETSNTAEPGELGDYLELNVSSDRLSSNLALPAIFNSFPQEADGEIYVRIAPLGPGETIDLRLAWQLPPETGNDIQGDTLSFTINYTLVGADTPAPASARSRWGVLGSVSLLIAVTGILAAFWRRLSPR